MPATKDVVRVLLDRYPHSYGQEVGADPASGNPSDECKGLGDVGVDIFFREVQVAWSELHPFVDDKALAMARRLDLADDPRALARVVPATRLPQLLGALVRTDLDGAADEVRDAAAGGRGPAGDPGQTKSELYVQAQDLDVAGRSSMDKDELAEAVRRQG